MLVTSQTTLWNNAPESTPFVHAWQLERLSLAWSCGLEWKKITFMSQKKSKFVMHVQFFARILKHLYEQPNCPLLLALNTLKDDHVRKLSERCIFTRNIIGILFWWSLCSRKLYVSMWNYLDSDCNTSARVCFTSQNNCSVELWKFNFKLSRFPNGTLLSYCFFVECFCIYLRQKA